ncbi:flavin-containing monooxygenase 5-like [Gigantopelta aegis]|uniref:flavin-containing monooxygenase 5-like n=1 Tax=Gigantopelta aegis TaxID=1735272 RepID=UPI001B88B5C9|nr:flavin-containing monooxygenase 5-like [Gigantopelta aegis]
MGKRIAVIGGGCCGLTAIKCCVDENLEPVCFERTDEIGGLWHFTEKVRDNLGCVMRSTIINTSKEMMCYSDFPIPKEYPNFMHNEKVWEYFKLYMDQFGLQQYIKYNTEVLHVKPSSDFEKTGQWKVDVRDHVTNEVTKHVFDGVLVCTGHHAAKHEPKFAGQEEFQGRILHSHNYKDSRGFEGKRIVVIGIGNSGGDVAVELSRCSKVFLSTRRGSWVFNRVFDKGLPLDMVFNTRMYNCMINHLPTSFLENEVRKKLNSRFDHRLYCLEPSYNVSAQHVMLNDDLPNRILSGTLTIKADVKRFTNTGLEFVDGTSEDNIDVVILATGYKFGFPFIDKSVIDVKMNRIELFKYMFPPDLAKPTLAVIGCIQPNGAIMPIAELQCRLAARVFKGDIILPEKSVMWQDIREKEAKMAKRFVQTQRHTIQVGFVDFMDQLAELIGCKPNVLSMLMSDPKLALKCWFGPCIPAQYRLTGPGEWSGARDVILTSWERMRHPLQTKTLPEGPETCKSSLPTKLIIMVVILAMLYMFLFGTCCSQHHSHG